VNEVLSKEELRQFLINYHNLNDYEGFPGSDGVIEYFKRVGSIQYDPLNVVGRNSDLVLQSKVRGHKPEILDVTISNFAKYLGVSHLQDYFDLIEKKGENRLCLILKDIMLMKNMHGQKWLRLEILCF